MHIDKRITLKITLPHHSGEAGLLLKLLINELALAYWSRFVDKFSFLCDEEWLS